MMAWIQVKSTNQQFTKMKSSLAECWPVTCSATTEDTYSLEPNLLPSLRPPIPFFPFHSFTSLLFPTPYPQELYKQERSYVCIHTYIQRVIENEGREGERQAEEQCNFWSATGMSSSALVCWGRLVLSTWCWRRKKPTGLPSPSCLYPLSPATNLINLEFCSYPCGSGR